MVDSVPGFGWAHFKTHFLDSLNNTLYFGGTFQKFNQYNTRSIIKFNGTTFDTLGSGINYGMMNANSQVTSIQKFQNKIYVFGDFLKTGNYYCKYIGRWNGTSWDTLNFKPNGAIQFTEIYNNELYVAGNFDSIGGIKSTGIAKFDGINWHSLNFSNGCVTAMKNFNGKLYLAGATSSLSSCTNIFYLNGNNWTPWVGVAGDVNKTLFGMSVIDTLLFVYGRFNSIAGTTCRGLAAYSGNKWYSFGNGLSNSSWETIFNIQKIDKKLYITGSFSSIEGVSTSSLNLGMSTNLAVLDSTNKWCAMSQPFDNWMWGVTKYNNNLFAYGGCRRVGNDSVWGLLKWVGGNATISCSNPISIMPSTVGINQIYNSSNISIYPNPTKDKLNIQLENFNQNNLSISITNYLGQVVKNYSISQNLTVLELSDLSNGIYFLNLQNNNFQKTIKFIKQ